MFCVQRYGTFGRVTAVACRDEGGAVTCACDESSFVDRRHRLVGTAPFDWYAGVGRSGRGFQLKGFAGLECKFRAIEFERGNLCRTIVRTTDVRRRRR